MVLQNSSQLLVTNLRYILMPDSQGVYGQPQYDTCTFFYISTNVPMPDDSTLMSIQRSCFAASILQLGGSWSHSTTFAIACQLEIRLDPIFHIARTIFNLQWRQTPANFTHSVASRKLRCKRLRSDRKTGNGEGEKTRYSKAMKTKKLTEQQFWPASVAGRVVNVHRWG